VKAFRIALQRYAPNKRDAFSGLSGFSTDGRWHTKGRNLDYCAESLSLATLERLVHYKRFNALEPHVLYTLDVPEGAITSVSTPPARWNDPADLSAAAQAMGNRWYDDGVSPALLVPSAVTPGERNLIVNTHHKEWRWKWVIAGPTPFAFDNRLTPFLKRGKATR
jgi:RES domain-containing protein